MGDVKRLNVITKATGSQQSLISLQKYKTILQCDNHWNNRHLQIMIFISIMEEHSDIGRFSALQAADVVMEKKDKS